MVLAALIYAISVIARNSRESPRLATVSEALKLGNFRDWRHVRTFGDERGPFAFKGSAQMWGGSGSEVWWYDQGQRRKFGLGEFAGQEVLLVSTFENEQGNTLALLFVRDVQADAPKAPAATEPD
jgi:hypothetical protein